MSLRLSLTPEMQGRFEAAATAADTSIAEQVRWRAEWLLARSADQPTLELMAAVADMAAWLERETGAAWHAHPGTHDALRQGIVSWMAQYKPEGDARFGPRPHQTEFLDSPLQLGIQAAFNNWEQKSWDPAVRQRHQLAKEKNFQELLKHQQREQGGGDD
jgi:hypothetical protein